MHNTFMVYKEVGGIVLNMCSLYDRPFYLQGLLPSCHLFASFAKPSKQLYRESSKFKSVSCQLSELGPALRLLGSGVSVVHAGLLVSRQDQKHTSVSMLVK